MSGRQHEQPGSQPYPRTVPRVLSNKRSTEACFGTIDDCSQPVEQDPSGRYLRYPILLGRGAWKRVFRAFDCELGREVAWNQVELMGECCEDHSEEERLFAEIQVLQQLHHKNIMSFHDWWHDRKSRTINFITEIFTSGTLRQYRKKTKVMNESILKRWAWQILEGLVYLHGHDPPIVHRDLKCDNIFINANLGQIKIGDLGLATAQQGLSVVGTPEFMAPEIYEEKYDEKVDIYSYGMCLLELATLEYPYSECHGIAHIFRKGVKPQALQRVIGEELRQLIELCIAHDPNDRPEARMLLKHAFFESLRHENALQASHGHLMGLRHAHSSPLNTTPRISLAGISVQGTQPSHQQGDTSLDGVKDAGGRASTLLAGTGTREEPVGDEQQEQQAAAGSPPGRLAHAPSVTARRLPSLLSPLGTMPSGSVPEWMSGSGLEGVSAFPYPEQGTISADAYSSRDTAVSPGPSALADVRSALNWPADRRRNSINISELSKKVHEHDQEADSDDASDCSEEVVIPIDCLADAAACLSDEEMNGSHDTLAPLASACSTRMGSSSNPCNPLLHKPSPGHVRRTSQQELPGLPEGVPVDMDNLDAAVAAVHGHARTPSQGPSDCGSGMQGLAASHGSRRYSPIMPTLKNASSLGCGSLLQAGSMRRSTLTRDTAANVMMEINGAGGSSDESASMSNARPQDSSVTASLAYIHNRKSSTEQDCEVYSRASSKRSPATAVATASATADTASLSRSQESSSVATAQQDTPTGAVTLPRLVGFPLPSTGTELPVSESLLQHQLAGEAAIKRELASYVTFHRTSHPRKVPVQSQSAGGAHELPPEEVTGQPDPKLQQLLPGWQQAAGEGQVQDRSRPIHGIIVRVKQCKGKGFAPRAKDRITRSSTM